jgi:hypothetical protein
VTVAFLASAALGDEPATEQVDALDTPAPRGPAWVRYTYANDLFTSTDYYFTQGMSLTWSDPLLRPSPLALPVLDLGPGAQRTVSLGWRYDGFTPTETEDREIQFDDRPFASYMYISHRTYIGPLVGARNFQTEVHRATDGPLPRGWQNQIDHDLVAQLEGRYSHRLLRASDALEIGLGAQLRAGTLYTDAALGPRMQLGWLGDASGAHDAGRAYLWAALQGRAVGYNAMLQGGVLNDSVHTIRSGSVRRGVATAQVGARMELETIELGFTVYWTSPEFNGGRHHAWGLWAVTIHY